LVVIPDAGHLSNLEQPDRFTAAVERFAERVLRRGC
jgi:pimeloyl-ACP methyl ester carboxylesterase